MITLDAPIKRRLRRPSRHPDDIPYQPAGTLLVAQVGGTYHVVADRTDLTDPVLVRAGAILVVSMTRNIVEAGVTLPSADPGTGIRINARFSCRVESPELALAAGAMDLIPYLTDHILAYSNLRMRCLSFGDVSHWYAFQQQMIAMLIAYRELGMVSIPGLAATLADADVRLQPLAMPTTSLTVEPTEFWETPAAPIGWSEETSRRRFIQQQYRWGGDR